MPDEAQIHLSPNEAIVLFELLSRWTEDGQAATPDSDCFESSAECAVLQTVLGCLEKQLVAPLRSDYAQTIEQARLRLADDWNGSTLRG